MPKYVIERQYLVPEYQHVVIEADSPCEAMKIALDDCPPEKTIGWEGSEIDYEGAQETTLNNMVEATDDELKLFSPAHLLYNAGKKLISIPDEFQ